MIRILTFLFALIPAIAAADEKIVLGLSQDEVSITASFTGSEILIFGAIRRDAPPPQTTELGVIIAVAGPNVPVEVRQKDRVAGIWVNTDSAAIDIAPSFYAIASSAPLSDVLLPLEDLHNAISWGRVVRAVGQDAFAMNEYTEAYMRIKQSNDLFQMLEGAVAIEGDTLFHTAIKLPSNLTEGDYKTRIFLTRDGHIIDSFQTEIPVYKVGIERWLYNLSQNQAALYGLLSLLIAAVAGWAASAAFAALRR